ncbi:MAG: polysulfide reductase NrfD [Dehalococcoidia bacterium]|nr:MAG: polysulfide reductase NrfD [Dehalococcoidia bacterium]
MKLKGRLWIIFLITLIGAGVFGAVMFAGRSESESIPWGLLVPGYIFFALAATGTSLVNSISTVFRVERFKPIIKRGILLSLILIIPAGIFIILDLGKASQAFNIYLLFHESSRLAWMGMLYLIFVVFLILQLISAIREERLPKWIPLSMGIIVLAATLTVETNLGALFGAVEAKPLWDSPVLPLQFIISAFMVGVCMHILFISTSYRTKDQNLPIDVKSLFTRDYRPLLIGLIIVNFIMIAAKFIPELMSAEANQYVKLLLAGPYSATFWGIEIIAGGIIPLILLLSSKSKESVSWLLGAAALITLGVFFSKYNLIIAGQSIGPTFTEGFISYFPSVYEILTMIGGFAVCLLMYTLGELLLPLEPKDVANWFIFAKKKPAIKGDTVV